MDADPADREIVHRQEDFVGLAAPDAAGVGLGARQRQAEDFASLQAQQALGQRHGEDAFAAEAGFFARTDRKLQTDAVDVGGEGAVRRLEVGLVGFGAAADVEVDQAVGFGDVDQHGQEALPALLEENADAVTAFDHAPQLIGDLPAVVQGAAFDFLFGVGVVHDTVRRDSFRFERGGPMSPAIVLAKRVLRQCRRGFAAFCAAAVVLAPTPVAP